MSKTIATAPRPSGKYIYFVSLGAIALLIVTTHLWKIGSVPHGLYQDEMANAYNAFLIVQHGHDEHGQSLPLYFRSFGDYKHPIIIYSLAAAIKLFGYSEVVIRSVSTAHFFILLVALYCLSASLFDRNKYLILFVLASAGFSPWLFTYSRISFAVITQLSLTCLSLLLIFKTYHTRSSSHFLLPALTGLVLGATLYTYSTARLLTFITITLWLLFYSRRRHLGRHIIVASACLLSLVPYLLFAQQNPGALTARLYELSPTLAQATPLDQVQNLIDNYLSHISAQFLLSSGDANLRHATGYMGQMHVIVFFLAIIGIAAVSLRSLPYRRYALFILFNAFAAPLAASVTHFGTPHATRSALVALYSLLLATYGLYFLLTISPQKIQPGLLAAVIFCIGLQSSFYLHHYFTKYAAATRQIFQSHGGQAALNLALARQPSQLSWDSDFGSSANRAAMHLLFYRTLLQLPDTQPITLRPIDTFTSGCIIYYPWNHLPPLPRLQDITPANSFLRLACVAPQT